jgi:hypothetical protein
MNGAFHAFMVVVKSTRTTDAVVIVAWGERKGEKERREGKERRKGEKEMREGNERRKGEKERRGC